MFYYDSLFLLEDAYNRGRTISEAVKKNMTGRLAGEDHDYGLICQAVYNAGGGNYLEIGSLFGGSALVVAVFMKNLSLDGKVIILDPLDGYYGSGNIDPVVKTIPREEIILENFEKFGVIDRLIIVKSKSYSFPKEAKRFTYSVSYIDGDHWGDMPWKDFLSVKDLTSKYIIFDNYDKSHPAVIKAALDSIRYGWVPVHISSISYIAEKNPTIVDRFGGVYEH